MWNVGDETQQAHSTSSCRLHTTGSDVAPNPTWPEGIPTMASIRKQKITFYVDPETGKHG